MSYSNPYLPNSILLPSKLERHLKPNGQLFGAVHQFLSHCGSLIESSNLPFFRQYTDHGCRHIVSVLQTCEELIPEESWKLITPADVAILTAAVVLHDFALHFQETAFQNLVLTRLDSRPLLFRDSNSWMDLWTDYLSEISRLDRRALGAIFGVAEPIAVPELSHPERWTASQYDLIGEFLRRNHPRIAHEIAVYGIPALDLPALSQFGFDQDFSELAGLVARSHGIDVRLCLSHLEERYHPRDYQGVHGVYLMIILRISDYIQIQSERAPQHLVRSKNLRSPISQREWQIHGSITNISTTEPDPEQLRIQINPATIKLDSLLRLQDWIKGIQSELDIGWAVIGEVYGRYYSESGQCFKLKLRRVKSDIDDIYEFRKKINYVPERIAFSSSGAELLKLLIAPLYGNHVEVGIRELLQNSLDAVREIRALQKSGEICSGANKFRDQEADVTIEINEGKRSLVISDKGIGMSAATIQNYFLKAGASFRNSDAWKKAFTDEDGNSSVLRSGRFGIGALAAFLIGDRIEVETRHIHETRGLRFNASLEDESILLEYIDCPIGTVIKIPLGDSNLKILCEKVYRGTKYDVRKWDWYSLEEPTLYRTIIDKDGVANTLERSHISPALGNTANFPKWNFVKCEEYDEVQWTYLPMVPEVTCNGIEIRPTDDIHPYRTDQQWFPPFSYPSISIFDSRGLLPLNLARDEIAIPKHELPHDDELRESVLKDFLAFCLRGFPVHQWHERPKTTRSTRLRYPGIAKQLYWVDHPSGATLLDPYLLKELGTEVVYFLNLAESDFDRIKLNMSTKTVVDSQMGGREHNSGFRDIFYDWYVAETRLGRDLFFSGARFLVSASLIDEWNKPRGFHKEFRRDASFEKINSKWGLIEIGALGSHKESPLFELAQTLDFRTHGQYICCSERFIDFERSGIEKSPASKAWMKFFAHPVLSYDLQERMELLKSSAEGLKDFMKNHLD